MIMIFHSIVCDSEGIIHSKLDALTDNRKNQGERDERR